MDYFKQKEAEEALGLSVMVPEKLAKGLNSFRAEVITASGPLTGASVILHLGNVKTTESDVSFILNETSPGAYEADITIPDEGKWVMRLEIDHQSIRTERRWFVLASAPSPLQRGRKKAGGADCDIHSGACVKEYDGGTIVFDASPKPVRSMSDLKFTVTVHGMKTPPPSLVLDLTMPGMKMGRNQVELRMTDEGRYEGAGVIIKCPSGRTLWRATVLSGETAIADFTFDVRN
jgi:hypothetical protein